MMVEFKPPPPTKCGYELHYACNKPNFDHNLDYVYIQFGLYINSKNIILGTGICCKN